MKLLVEKHGSLSLLKGRILCTAFFEPSTRTMCSFEAAMMRLGGNTIAISPSTSSIAKGESNEDTSILIRFITIFMIKSLNLYIYILSSLVRTLASYGDIIVMRHPEPNRYFTLLLDECK